MAGVETDWGEWLRRWEAQQGHHMPRREERFQVIIAGLRARSGDRPRVLDLGCGPGSLAVRILAALPGAEVVAIDRDPVLLRLGREALGGRPGLSFADADLGDPRLRELGAGFDAAVSTTALHWLDLTALRELYRNLAAMLRPGAILLNGDRQHASAGSELEELCTEVRRAADAELDRGGGHASSGSTPGPEGGAAPPTPAAGVAAETWETWWGAVEEEPAFAVAVEERRLRHHDHPHRSDPPTLRDHEEALRAAGFREVGSLWQHWDDRVLAAIR